MSFSLGGGGGGGNCVIFFCNLKRMNSDEMEANGYYYGRENGAIDGRRWRNEPGNGLRHHLVDAVTEKSLSFFIHHAKRMLTSDPSDL